MSFTPENRRKSVRRGAKATRRSGEVRQREIVVAAYEILTERGFEGLRIRDVAARVGINSATLHYYFPSKEDLIRAVATYLAEAYAADQAPDEEETGATTEAQRLLRREFQNSRHWRRNRPDLLTVTREFLLRALRYPELRPIFERDNARWREQIERFLVLGVESGVYRSDLDVHAAATILMSFLWGAAPFLDVDSDAFDRACVEFERLLRAPE